MTTIPRVVWEFIAATNATDPDWLDALFTEDCIVDACGYHACGRAAISSWSERELFEAKITINAVQFRQSRGATVVRVDAVDRGAIHECEFEFHTDGRYIESLRISTGSRNRSRSTEALFAVARRS